MNNLLELKVKFNHEVKKNGSIVINLRAHNETTIEKIESLEENLRSILRYYDDNERFINGYLIDVNYNDIIAKSNRISELLKPIGKEANDIVVGARFSNSPEGKENHIITYYVDKETIIKTLSKLAETKRFIREQLDGKAVPQVFNETKNKTINLDYTSYSSKSCIRKMIVDCSVVESFSVPNVSVESYKDTFLVTFFQTEKTLAELLESLKIDTILYRYSDYGQNTISVPWDLYLVLHEKVPYMISMISSDLSQLSPDIFEVLPQDYMQTIPAPQNEPIIGVIDNLFDENVYFSKWVDNHDYLEEYDYLINKNIERNHGTAVSSIIVDGPALNPWLDDECGRFRVRHFGVCEKMISVPRLVKKIKEIVNDNPDIHVWNLSLGTDDEVSKNFISFDASVLDELQARKNIIFVISGTNDNRETKKDLLRVGSPADSLNAIVVNSVKRNGQVASYSRKGTVLSFFNKPDVSFYGGDYEKNERINACTSRGIEAVYGTSFAAPWISRKLAFLMEVIGFPREIAKALIIDSAAGWDYKNANNKFHNLLGYGTVPIKISDILSVNNREIKFVMYGTSETYKTSNYAIPVPKDNDNNYPFIARATLCYFPECRRSQGVDYTSRELSLKFGRIKPDGKIEDINNNTQDDEGSYTDERKSRKDFRKWENTKFISAVLRKNRPLKSYAERMWGISLISKERLSSHMKSGINFGVVVTLREINGINRIQDFITSCMLRGWIINEINMENRLELYNKNQEEIFIE